MHTHQPKNFIKKLKLSEFKGNLDNLVSLSQNKYRVGSVAQFPGLYKAPTPTLTHQKKKRRRKKKRKRRKDQTWSEDSFVVGNYPACTRS